MTHLHPYGSQADRLVQRRSNGVCIRKRLSADWRAQVSTEAHLAYLRGGLVALTKFFRDEGRSLHEAFALAKAVSGRERVPCEEEF